MAPKQATRALAPVGKFPAGPKTLSGDFPVKSKKRVVARVPSPWIRDPPDCAHHIRVSHRERSCVYQLRGALGSVNRGEELYLTGGKQE